MIAVSSATRRDVEHLLGIRPERIRLVYSAPDPEFSQSPLADLRYRAAGCWNVFRFNTRTFCMQAEFGPHKNIPRLIEAFAVVRGELENHPKYKDLRLLIIGDEISRNPEVRRAVAQTRTEQVVRFLGFVPFDTSATVLFFCQRLRLSVAL